MSEYNGISLFSGIGGDTLGMKMAGIKIIGYNEKNKDCLETLKNNFPESTCISDKNGVTDITKIPDEIFLKYKNKVDIIFSGFPCQSFSNSGKKKAFDDPRGQMYLETIRVLDLIKPPVFIAENVTGLLQRTTTDNLKVFEIMKRDFENIGYKIYHKVLNSLDFGIPQSRKRVFIVGIKNNIKSVFEFPNINKKSSLKNIIENELNNSSLIQNKVPDIKPFFINNNNNIPEGTTHPFLLKNIELDRLSFGKRISPNHGEILDPDKYSKTIICSYTFQPRLYVCIQNNNGFYVRVLNTNELKQLQGFSKDYMIYGNTNSVITGIGNAVPPVFVKEICLKIKECLELHKITSGISRL